MHVSACPPTDTTTVLVTLTDPVAGSKSDGSTYSFIIKNIYNNTDTV